MTTCHNPACSLAHQLLDRVMLKESMYRNMVLGEPFAAVCREVDSLTAWAREAGVIRPKAEYQAQALAQIPKPPARRKKAA